MAATEGSFDHFIQNYVPGPLRNKYFIATIVFCGWLIFFDRNDIISQIRLQRTFNEMETKKQYYIDEIKQVNQDKAELFTNDRTIEKFAREHYLMKKDDEDVFVIVDKNEN